MRERTSSGLAAGDVDAVDDDAAGRRIVEAQQQLERRALAGARRTDEGDVLARSDVEREAVERERSRAARDTGRKHPRSGCDLAPEWKRLRIRGRDDRGRRIAQLDEPLHRAGCALHFAPHFAERRRRNGHIDGVDQELAQFAAGHLVRKDPMRALPEHERDRAEDHHRSDSGQRSRARVCGGLRRGTNPRQPCRSARCADPRA